MTKTLLRRWLLDKKSKTYTVIITEYYDQLNKLNTSMFKEWLSVELDVPIHHINEHSINSAKRRYKKAQKKNGQKEVQNPPSDPFNTSIPDKIKFN